VDPSVSRALFDREIEVMRGMARYNGGGWEIVSSEFPDLVVEIPHATGARRRFRFSCIDWDEQPPAVKSVDESGSELEGQPSGHLFMQLNTGWGLCAPGTREYHAHHAENPWAQHRDTTSLAQIVVRVASHYRAASP